MAAPLEVFFSYAHIDEAWRKKIETYLSTLKRQKLIHNWHDRNILAGEEWASAIKTHLNTASIILLLVSQDFIDSDYCWNTELKQAIKLHNTGNARVIPIIVRPADWANTPFAKLQALPKDGKAITTWPNEDEALLEVAQGIRKVIEDLKKGNAIIAAPSLKKLGAINIFISYADKDDKLREELENHLSFLKQAGEVTTWHRRKISSGVNWEKKVDEQINLSQLILLLISADFIASDYCFSIELRQAIERHKAKEACVIPVILRAVNWEKTPFGALPPLPGNGKPITSWLNRDEAFTDVTKGIEKAIKEFVSERYPDLLPFGTLQHNKELNSYNSISILPLYQSLSLREITTGLKSSVDGKKFKACKLAIQETHKQLSEVNLRNIYSKDFNMLRQKLVNTNKKLESIKDKQVIDFIVDSIETIHTNIEESIAELELFLLIFEQIMLRLDKIRIESVNISDIGGGVHEFYKSLNNCQNYLSLALQQFLI